LGTEEDRIFLPITLLFFAFPFLLGSRIRVKFGDHLIPFGILLISWLSWPSWGNVLGMDFAFIYQRFAIFIFPFYILLFQRKSDETFHTTNIASVREGIALSSAVLACWIFFGIQSTRMINFAHESSDFDKVVSHARPKQLALFLVFDGKSPASNNNIVYRTFPAWYQAENGGVVEPNFAGFLNQVILFRSNTNTEIPKFGTKSHTFRWKDNNADRFQYIFVRKKDSISQQIFDGASCEISSVSSVGTWTLFRGCAAFR